LRLLNTSSLWGSIQFRVTARAKKHFYDNAVNQALRLQSFRNRDLRHGPVPKTRVRSQQRRRASGRITRTLQLLRSHELIDRVPKTNYYRLNKKGQTEMMTALQFRITDLALLGLEKLC